jgi:hypothetical protein
LRLYNAGVSPLAFEIKAVMLSSVRSMDYQFCLPTSACRRQPQNSRMPGSSFWWNTSQAI